MDFVWRFELVVCCQGAVLQLRLRQTRRRGNGYARLNIYRFYLSKYSAFLLHFVKFRCTDWPDRISDSLVSTMLHFKSVVSGDGRMSLTVLSAMCKIRHSHWKLWDMATISNNEFEFTPLWWCFLFSTNLHDRIFSTATVLGGRGFLLVLLRKDADKDKSHKSRSSLLLNSKF